MVNRKTWDGIVEARNLKGKMARALACWLQFMEEHLASLQEPRICVLSLCGHSFSLLGGGQTALHAGGLVRNSGDSSPMIGTSLLLCDHFIVQFCGSGIWEQDPTTVHVPVAS